MLLKQTISSVAILHLSGNLDTLDLEEKQAEKKKVIQIF